MTNFLPEGFETLQTTKSYINLPKLPEGEHKFRIVKRPIAGWVDWYNKKPYRFRPDKKPAQSFEEDKPMKAFWALYVWDYQQSGLYIMEVTQMGILKALTHLAKDEDWGDFTTYDIKIKKSGSGKETEYSVSPVPHKPMLDKITDALERCPVNLDALYEGGDPWRDVPIESQEPTVPVIEGPKTIETLGKFLEDDDIDPSYLIKYVKSLSSTKKQTIDNIVESALLPELLPKFKAAYLKYVATQSEQSLVA